MGQQPTWSYLPRNRCSERRDPSHRPLTKSFVFPLLTGLGQRHQVKALSRVSSKSLVSKLQFPEFRASQYSTRRSVSAVEGF